MKKKLLKAMAIVPIIGTTIPLVTLAACKKNNPGGTDETKHVKEEHDDPVLEQDFVITYTLDSGYCLDSATSKIVFTTESNGTSNVYLNQCDIDTDAKTITVPASLVASTTVTVTLKSATAATSDKEVMKQVIRKFFADDATKNCILSGNANWIRTVKNTGQSEITDAYGKFDEASINMLKHDVQVHSKGVTWDKSTGQEQPSETTWAFVHDQGDAGWWLIDKNQTTLQTQATPWGTYPLFPLINDTACPKSL